MLKGQVDFSKSIMLHLILDLKVKTQKWSTLVLQGVTVYSVPARWLWLPTHSLSFISHPFFSWVITSLRLFVWLSAASIITIQLIFIFFFSIINYWLLLFLSIHQISFGFHTYIYCVAFWFLLIPSHVFLLHALSFPCWGSCIEAEGEGRRGQHLRQPLNPLPSSHPPSITSDCPLSTRHTNLDESSHKDWGLL